MNEEKEWVEVEVNAPAPEAPKADAAPVEKPAETEEKPDDSELGHRAQKRIRKLVAERKEADEQAQRLKFELEALRKEADEIRRKARESESTAYDLYGKSAQDKLAIAQKKIKDAFDSADKDALVEALDAMSDAKLEVRAIQAYKTATPQGEPQQAPPAPPAPPQPQLAPATKEWMDSNPWFGRGPNADRTATAAAVAISDDLIEEGFDPASPEFYGEVEKRLVAEMPRLASKLGKEKEPEPRRPVVAGQSRTPGRRIRLDEGTVRASTRLGASLEDTARYMEKIQDAGDGYVNIDIKRGRK